MPRIARVRPNSLAEELELAPGDEILTINGQPIKDIIDLSYALATEEMELEVKRANGETWIIEVEKDYDEGLGVDWEHPTVDRVRLCHNKCVFCFVDQIPKNMRETLNVRDDDYRLSFLHGNFVTLTNVKDEELQRIVDMKMSPLNISVHTTNPELRVRMLANKRSGEILRQIAFLAEHGIEMNTQVVLCPEWNDGPELDRTIRDLYPFFPAVRTLSVVPVGLTKHRRGLHKLRPCTPEEARQVIAQVRAWQDELRPKLRASFVHAADEFYVLADMDVPPSEYYDEFGQTENGVGVIRTFLDELEEAWPYVPKRVNGDSRKVAVVTAVSAAKTIRNSLARLDGIAGLTTEVFPVVNDFYGHHVTVTGLLTGQDIAQQLSGRIEAFDTVLLPDIMLKDEEDVFLDDWTVERLSMELGKPVTVVPATGRGLLFGVLGYTQALPPRRRYEATLRNMDEGLGAQDLRASS
ncbi:MAG: radical SAM protein [Alicyclobacillus herbarius]|uniref:radical SAM protein n=1 Tax=Alicyclobacillus herbarius TaxID=122960 RepID=UPI00041F30FD|nr:radical SAM protein [Alicyclobacillus herbarius]MCL6631305.1 radical SAM protein [Alicyclobacillus herbarius]